MISKLSLNIKYVIFYLLIFTIKKFNSIYIYIFQLHVIVLVPIHMVHLSTTILK